MNTVSWYIGFVFMYYSKVHREEEKNGWGWGLIYAEVIFTKVVTCKFKSLSE